MSGHHDATIERDAYRFIPGPFQYSAGVAAKPGFAMQRVRFAEPVPLVEGFRRIEAFMTARGPALHRLLLRASCARRRRSPMPGSPRSTASMSARWSGGASSANEENPVARSNVCPELHKPDGPSFHAFSLAVPAPGAPASFVVAGSGESQEGPGEYRDRTVRFGDTRVDGMREKIAHVMTVMERRMAAFGATWADTTAAQVYTVFDIHPHLASGLVERGGARNGVDWHYCRPPVIGLDYEMDCRGVHTERVIPA